MGAWSEDILGSDNALDTLGLLGEMIALPGNQRGGKISEVSLYPLPKSTDRETIIVISEALERNEGQILGQSWDDEDWPVLAAAYLATGTRMPLTLKEKAICACQDEIKHIRKQGWSDPKARIDVLRKHIVLIVNHEPRKISNVEHTGLFQTIVPSETPQHKPSLKIENAVQDIMETIRKASPSLTDDEAALIEAKLREHLSR